MEIELQLFRIKTTWMCENPETAALEKTKTEEIVQAINYTEAEKIAYELAEKEFRYKLGSVDIEIVRMKPSEIVYNDCLVKDENLVCGLIYSFFEGDEHSGEGLYNVTVTYPVINEKNGKEKYCKETILVAATSNNKAYDIALCLFQKSMNNNVTVKDVKFDRASALLLDPKYYENIVSKQL